MTQLLDALVDRVARDRVNFGNDPTRVRLDDLAASVEINLVAIIMRRVMARRDNNAGVRPQMADRKGKLRCRRHLVREKHRNACLRQHLCRDARKRTRSKARVLPLTDAAS